MLKTELPGIEIKYMSELCAAYLAGMPYESVLEIYKPELMVSPQLPKQLPNTIKHIEKDVHYGLYTGSLRYLFESTYGTQHVENMPVTLPAQSDPNKPEDLCVPYRTLRPGKHIVLMESRDDCKIVTRKQYEAMAWDEWAQRASRLSMRMLKPGSRIMNELTTQADVPLDDMTKFRDVSTMFALGLTFDAIAEKLGLSKELVRSVIGQLVHLREWTSRFTMRDILTRLYYGLVDIDVGGRTGEGLPVETIEQEPALVESMLDEKGDTFSVLYFSRPLIAPNSSGGQYTLAVQNPDADCEWLKVREIDGKLFEGSVRFLEFEGKQIRQDLLQLL